MYEKPGWNNTTLMNKPCLEHFTLIWRCYHSYTVELVFQNNQFKTIFYLIAQKFESLGKLPFARDRNIKCK